MEITKQKVSCKWLWIYLALNFLDCLFTAINLQMGATEANPILSGFNIYNLVVVKISIIFGIALLIDYLNKKRLKLFVVGVMTAVVTYNVLALVIVASPIL